MLTRELPESLRRYAVEQRYDRYDAADQATWRFVMLHLYDHLREHAHPSYVAGLQGTGLSIERIPRIAEIDAALAQLGWRAIAISGFIAPRAFQAFQAAGILPVAAEIRSPAHLAYTPAPDIIHEAAGHAPILVNQEYGDYLRRVGEAGQLAFSSPADARVTEAITNLSAIKEQHSARHEQLALAERQLEEAVAAASESSEATRMARLYWWTAEYGLIGTPQDYRLYGAGLLSSLGEAYHCRGDVVRKLPLSLEALDVDYDITKPQPQLFVARDFTHLMDVLAEARRELAAVGALPAALGAAIKSGQPARIELGQGRAIEGCLSAFGGSEQAVEYLEFNGACRCIEFETERQLGAVRFEQGEDLVLPTGTLESVRLAGRVQSAEAATGLFERVTAAGGQSSPHLALPAPVELRYASGIEVAGTLTGLATHTAKRVPGTPSARRVTSLQLRSAVVKSAAFTRWYDRVLLALNVALSGVRPADDGGAQTAPAAVTASNEALAHPGSCETATASRFAPDVKQLSEKQSALRDLYERAEAIWSDREGAAAVPLLEAIGDRLGEFPEDWLLRWNLLECLLKLGAVERTAQLVRELEALELQHQKQQPIATGLRSLRMRVRAAMNSSKPPNTTGNLTS